MNQWDLFVLSLVPEAVEAERAPTLREVIGEQFGTPAHKQMLRAHEDRKSERQLMVAKNNELLAAASLELVVAEARGWEERRYSFEEWQLEIASKVLAGKEAA